MGLTVCPSFALLRVPIANPGLVDWEHPSNPTEGTNYIHLLSCLRDVFPSPEYVLATCLPAGEWALRNIDLSKAQRHLDLLNIMAYDFTGPWTNTSGHHAQLHSTSKSPTSAQSAVSYVLNQGVHAKKLLLGEIGRAHV